MMRFRQSISLKTYAAGSRDTHGEWTDGAATTTAIKAEIAPRFQTDMERREGERIAEEVKIFSYDSLPLGATFEWQSEQYRITETRSWRPCGRTVREAVAVRIEGQDGGDIPEYTDAGNDLISRWVRKHVALGSDLDSGLVIPGDGPGPVPLETFADVTRIAKKPVRVANRNLAAATTNASGDLVHGTETVVQEFQATYLIRWHRDEAAAAADRFLQWIDSTEASYREGKDRILLCGTVELRRLGEHFGERIQTMVEADLTVQYPEEWDAAAVPRMATAELEITHDPDGTTETVEVT